MSKEELIEVGYVDVYRLAYLESEVPRLKADVESLESKLRDVRDENFTLKKEVERITGHRNCWRSDYDEIKEKYDRRVKYLFGISVCLSILIIVGLCCFKGW